MGKTKKSKLTKKEYSGYMKNKARNMREKKLINEDFTQVLTEDENVEVTNENNEEACPSSEEIKIEKDPIDEPLPEISAPSQQTNVINTAVIKPQTIKNKKPKKNVSVKRKTKEQLLQLLAEKEEEIKRQYKIICILQDKNRLLKKKLAIALNSEDLDLDSDDNYSVSTQMSDPKPDPCSPIPNEELPSPVKEGVDSVSNINQDPDGQIMEELVYQPDYNNATVGTIDSTDPLINVKEEPMYDTDDDGGGSDEEFVDTQFALSDYFPENEEQVIKQGMNLDGESNVVSDPP